MDKSFNKTSKEKLLHEITALKNQIFIKYEELARLENSSIKDSNENLDVENPFVSLERYKIVSDLTSDFAYAFSVDSENVLKYEWGFGALFGITGFTRAELIEKGGWKTLLYEKDVRTVGEQFNLLLEGKPHTQEYRIVTRDGKIKWVRDYARPVIDEVTGKVKFIYGAIQDITEMRKADESLQLSKLVLENSPAVLFRWKAEENWPVEYVSENIVQFGYSQNDFLNNKISYANIIHTEDIDRVAGEVEKYSESNTNNFRQQYRIHSSDGKIYWVDDRTNVERDINGKPLYFQGIILDITENKIAENSLKESEERLRLALNSANQGLYDLDIQSGEAIVSPEYATMLGYDPNKFKETNKKWIERLHPDDLAKTSEIYQSYVNGEISDYRVEFRQKTATDNWIWIQSSGKIVEWDQNGKPKRMLGTHTDINSKKITEFALRDSEKQYKLLFSKNPNPMLVFEEKTLNFLDANQAAIEHYGYTREEFIKMSIKDIRPKEDVEKMLKVVQNLSDGISVAKGYRHKKKNGEIIHVDATATSINFNGKEARLVVVHDITEKFVAEKALRESEEKYRTIFTDSHDCIFVASPDGYIININTAGIQLFELTYNEVDNFNFLDLFISLQEKEQFESNILESGFVKDYSVKLRGKSLFVLDCLLTASVRKNALGEVISYQGIIRDITEERKAKEELVKAKEHAERADRLKTEFLAQMSHEIRTPINSIMSYAQLLKTETIDLIPEDLRFSFDMINNGGKRLIRTVDLILNMSEIQTGTYDLIIEKCNIIDLIDNLVQEFKSGAKAKNLELSFSNELDEKNSTVNVDIYTITQIFANLIDNAIKYTLEGYINVKVYKNDNDKLCIDVKDTGIGISKEFQERLFDAFSQEEQGYTRKFEGNGLGMALVKEYCKMNRAEISVESEKGKGSIFKVEFPLILN